VVFSFVLGGYKHDQGSEARLLDIVGEAREEWRGIWHGEWHEWLGMTLPWSWSSRNSGVSMVQGMQEDTKYDTSMDGLG
jgi:hypothetical protein